MGDDFLRPAQTRVATGDTVVWKWLGPDGESLGHGGSGPGGELRLGSRQVRGGDRASGRLRLHASVHEAGRFTYRCRVHPAMTGEVTVIALAAARRHAARASVAAERAPGPGLPALHAALPATRAYLHLRLSRARDGRGPDRPRRARALASACERSTSTPRKGRARHRLHVRGFEPGPYRLRLVAYDYANNRSRSKRVRFRVGSARVARRGSAAVRGGLVGAVGLAAQRRGAAGSGVPLAVAPASTGQHQAARRARRRGRSCSGRCPCRRCRSPSAGGRRRGPGSVTRIREPARNACATG